MKTILYPNYLYKVGTDIPSGYYLFVYSPKYDQGKLSFCVEDEAAFHLYPKYESSHHRVSYSNFGCVNVNDEYGYVEIKNGLAVYWGQEKFNLHSLLSHCDTIEEIIYKNEIIEIRMCKNIPNAIFFRGGEEAIISYQYWFSVNSTAYWLGGANVLTFKPYREITFCMVDQDTGCTFEFNGQETGWEHLYEGNDYFVCKIPSYINTANAEIKWLKSNKATQISELSKMDTRQFHSDIYHQTEDLLTKFSLLGLKIDIQREMEYFLNAPDLMHECFMVLDKCWKNKAKIERKRIDKDLTFSFEVNATYNKRYYCAAKIADNAQSVKYNIELDSYTITFNANDVESIALMYYNLAGMVNEYYSDFIIVFDFISQHDFYSYVKSQLDECLSKLRSKFGYSTVVSNSVLMSLIKAIKVYQKSKLDLLYKTIKKEGRVPSKWSNEYKLYVAIKRYVPDAQYQHRCAWLGSQSFDIFLPTQNIAIEYQGEQHYKSLEIFGGEEGFAETKRRDEQKQKLSSENGVALKMWNYIYHVSDTSVKSFLQKNGIDIIHDVSNEYKSEMAPLII